MMHSSGEQGVMGRKKLTRDGRAMGDGGGVGGL